METMHQLGRYEIVAELRPRAMGAVFRARDPKIDRTVAIKTISVPAAPPRTPSTPPASASSAKPRLRAAFASGNCDHL